MASPGEGPKLPSAIATPSTALSGTKRNRVPSLGLGIHQRTSSADRAPPTASSQTTSRTEATGPATVLADARTSRHSR